MIRRALGLMILAIFVMAPVVAAQPANTPDETMKESFRLKLEADREQIYGMSREERHQYMADYFGNTERGAERRAAKAALEQVRSEWDITEHPKPKQADNRRGEKALKVAGTNITYDTGTVAGVAGVASQMVGNRFDTALNPPGTMCCFPVETSGSVTQITFDMVVTFFGSAVWSLYSNVAGTMANQVTSKARPGIMTGLNTLAVMSPTTANAYMNGTFLAGIWQFDPTMTGLAVDTGTTGGQGFHAISINDGAVGTGLTTVTYAGMGANAIFRVSGNLATPVELMDFTIE